MLVFFFEITETTEIGLLLQWAEANVENCFLNCGNHWNWIAFAMSESQCWYLFLESQKPLNWIALQLAEANVGICFWNHKNHWNWIVFAMNESQCWELFLKSWKPQKLDCFCNEWKQMLGLRPRIVGNIGVDLLL